MYNPKSKKAEEFINHEEILETLAYADAHALTPGPWVLEDVLLDELCCKGYEQYLLKLSVPILDEI